MEAIDDLIARYGPEAKLEDAILIYDISLPSEDEDEDGEKETELCSRCTSYRMIVAVGLATSYVHARAGDLRAEEP